MTFSFSRDVDALPAVKIIVDGMPCTDPKQQVNAITFPTELQQGKMCFEEPNTGLTVSPTYKTVGSSWSTNEWAVEQENRVGWVTSTQPSYFVYANPIAEKAAIMKPWSKPIAPWKLECETATDPITRLDVYNKLYGKRFDSKGIVQHMSFTTLGVVLIIFGVVFQIAIFFTFVTEFMYFMVVIQKIIAFIITAILLARLYKANVRFAELKDSLTSAMLLQTDCGDPYARINPEYSLTQLVSIEKRLGTLYRMTWAVMATFILEVGVVLLVLLCALCHCNKDNFLSFSEWTDEFRAFNKAFKHFN